MRKSLLAALLAVFMFGSVAPVPVFSAEAGVASSSRLRKAVTAKAIFGHLQVLEKIAAANLNNRASGTPGYDESAAYVAEELSDAGYDVTLQPFEFAFWEELADPALDLLPADSPPYVVGEDLSTMEYSGSGEVTGSVIATKDIVILPAESAGTSNSGCEPGDFPRSTDGNIALIQRGTCPFEVKAENAREAGARGVIIFNEGRPGSTDPVAGTLGRSFDIPVVSTSFPVGKKLYELAQAGGVMVHLATSTLFEIRPTVNVLADTPGGKESRTMVIGGHLDSVPMGPGINDNGSGTATILEVALRMAELDIKPRNNVRFAFWGAEEYGLIGSQYYVSQLSDKERKDIALYLNFDMVASPNYVRFVYDGDGSDSPQKGPAGSGAIEDIFVDYFDSQDLASAPTALEGNSDYAPFIGAGIPAGGLFTGADGIKTREQAKVYGGEAGASYDPCYHTACDDITNVNRRALNEMSDAVAHATLKVARMRSSALGRN